MNMSRRVLAVWSGVTITGVIALAISSYLLFFQDDYTYKGGTLTPSEKAPALDLVDQQGQPFSLREQEGKVVLLYFGYTYCPDFCPTTLAEMQSVEDELGNEADRVEVVMVTVDPERDTPERLNEYMSFFNPEFIGLSGTPEQTLQIQRAYGVTAVKREAEGSSQYLVDHSTSLYAVDPEGYLRVVWPYGTEPKDIASDVEHLLDS